MAYTATSIIGRRLEPKLAPWMSEDLARLLDSIGYMAQPLAEILQEEGLDGEAGFVPAYGKLFDPDLCPAKYLPYLGQFVGVSIPVGASESEARALVKAEAGLNRGTRSSIESAIQRAISNAWMPLTAYTTGQLVYHEVSGAITYYKVQTNFTTPSTFNTTHLEVISITAQYDLLERERPDGEEDAYFFTVVVRPEQLTPAGNSTQLKANVNAVKPAGLLWEIVESDETPLIDEFTRIIKEIGGEEIVALTLAEVT
jgi:Phage tail protein (Tail_P2_I)